MADAALEILSARVSGGIVVVPQGYPCTRHPRIDILQAGRLKPSPAAVSAAQPSQ
jgi:hypothetical protein